MNRYRQSNVSRIAIQFEFLTSETSKPENYQKVRQDMQHDEVPLPTNKYRRRSSLFEVGNEEQNKSVKLNIPDEKSEVYYPLEYIDKVKTEIELWEMHVSKTFEEKQKFKNKKMELQNSTVNENILSIEQLDFLASLNFDHYMNRVEKFCNRAVIFAQQIQYEPKSEVEIHYPTVQSKIEKEIFGGK